MNTNFYWRLGICVLFATNCYAQRIQTQSVTHGIFDCFNAGGTVDGKTCYCETSAVAYLGNETEVGSIFLASDKNMPNGTAVFKFLLAPDSTKSSGWKLDTAARQYIQQSPIRDAKKYEDFSTTADRSWTFAITGFDRTDGAHQTDDYNMLLAWQTETTAQVISPSTNKNNVTSSIALREPISKVLATHYKREKVAYFKIEGLAVLPKNKLLFGVREMGNSYSDFTYTIDIIQVSYSIENEKIVLKDDWKMLYSIPNKIKVKGLIAPLALSSIEYDPYGKRLYMLTSFELEKEGIGAYLWVLDANQIKKQLPPSLVYNGTAPLRFSHKAEDLTPIGENQVFIIHDDDRVLDFGDGEIPRKPHQAAYTIVKLTIDKKWLGYTFF